MVVYFFNSIIQTSCKTASCSKFLLKRKSVSNCMILYCRTGSWSAEAEAGRRSAGRWRSARWCCRVQAVARDARAAGITARSAPRTQSGRKEAVCCAARPASSPSQGLSATCPVTGHGGSGTRTTTALSVTVSFFFIILIFYGLSIAYQSQHFKKQMSQLSGILNK